MLISPLHIVNMLEKTVDYLATSGEGCSTEAYPYVTQLMVYLLIPFQEAIFINFCGNWTLATIQNTKKKNKMKERDGHPCFFSFTTCTEWIKWENIMAANSNAFSSLLSTVFRIYGVRCTHNYDFQWGIPDTSLKFYAYLK